MNYNPGISNRADAWIAQGNQNWARIAEGLVGYLINRGNQSRELRSTVGSLLAYGDGNGAGAAAGPDMSDAVMPGESGFNPMAPGQAGAASSGDDAAPHPLVQQGKQADALRKYVQSLNPNDPDVNHIVKGLGLDQLNGIVRAHSIYSAMQEHAAKMSELNARAEQHRQQVLDDQKSGEALYRFATTPEVRGESADGEPGPTTRPPTFEERMQRLMTTPGLSGRPRALGDLMDKLDRYQQVLDGGAAGKKTFFDPNNLNPQDIAGFPGLKRIITGPNASELRETPGAGQAPETFYDKEQNPTLYKVSDGKGGFKFLRANESISPAELAKMQMTQARAHRTDHLSWTTSVAAAKEKLNTLDPKDKKQAAQYKDAQDALNELKGQEPKLEDYLAPIKGLGKSATAATAAPKVLDAATARDYLTKAGGDKDKARQMATKDGYSF